MNEENVRSSGHASPPRLECSGVWGGIRNRDLEIRAGKVIGSLYSAACDGGRGGDIYYFGVCRDGRNMRLAVADVAGHGKVVAEVGQFVYDSLRRHMCDIHSEVILGEINRLIGSRGLEAMTTAAVVAYNSDQGLAYVSYAGHPPVLFKGSSDAAWSIAEFPHGEARAPVVPMDIPLAVDSGAIYRPLELPMAPGDRLLVYTDGITEAPSPEGDIFGQGRLKEILDANAEAPLSELKAAVLRAVLRHTRTGLTHDDVTLIALEIC